MNFVQKHPKIEVGNVFKTNASGKLEILYITNSKKVEVKFTDTGYMTTTSAGNIRLGKVLDKLHPRVYGVGYIGESKLKRYTSVNSNIDNVWRGMLRRCYCEKQQSRNPSYIGCSVCVEWHNFQTFAKWFEENYIEGFQLDKDTKVVGNRVYSPNTCVFISKTENTKHSANKRWSR
jgi:hypothetical protein